MKDFLVTLIVKGVVKHKILVKSSCLQTSVTEANSRFFEIDKINYLEDKSAEMLSTEFTIFEEQGYFVCF